MLAPFKQCQRTHCSLFMLVSMAGHVYTMSGWVMSTCQEYSPLLAGFGSRGNLAISHWVQMNCGVGYKSDSIGTGRKIYLCPKARRFGST